MDLCLTSITCWRVCQGDKGDTGVGLPGKPGVPGRPGLPGPPGRVINGTGVDVVRVKGDKVSSASTDAGFVCVLKIFKF